MGVRIGAGWALPVPDGLSAAAVDLLDDVNARLGAHAPAGLDRSASTLEVEDGEARIVLAGGALRATLETGFGDAVRLEVVAGDVHAGTDLDPGAGEVDDVLAALLAGGVEARAAVDEDGEALWFLRITTDEGDRSMLGEVALLDVFAVRLGEIVELGSFAR